MKLTLFEKESFISQPLNSNVFLSKNIFTLFFFAPKYSNLIIIKSMSKDFGIAGIRAGYAIMSPSRVETLLKRAFLWNVFSALESRSINLLCSFLLLKLIGLNRSTLVKSR